MAELQAKVEFSNVVAVDSFTMTLAHGVTPSQGILRIAPQPKNIRTISNLVMRFGNERIVLTDCLADEGSYEFNASGQVVSLRVLDRRWAWRISTITGHYNFRDANGELYKNKRDGAKPDKKETLSDCERTPKELLELLLLDLRESNYILEGIPAELRPEVHWDDDSTALALQSLCDVLGLRVILQIDGRIAIRPVGVGRAIPNGPVEEYGASVDPPERPRAFFIRGGPTWYQFDAELEAVGLEKDGSIKKLDDLSYKPPGGWTEAEPVELDFIISDQDRECARASVYRWYAVKLPLVKIAGKTIIRAENPKEIEILGVQIYTRKMLDAVEHYPAIVWGDWYDREAVLNTSEFVTELEDTAGFDLSRLVVPIGFSIDRERLIVKFSSPVWKQNESNQAIPAVLKLRTALLYRLPSNGSYRKYYKERDGDKNSKLSWRVYSHPELVEYLDAKGKSRNGKDLDKLAEKYLDAYEREYKLTEAETVRYAGWLRINPDGALQSVTWSMDGSGATTTVQRNDDRGSPTTLSYKLRRLYEKYNKAVRDAAKRDADTQKEWREDKGLPPSFTGLP